MAVDGEYDEDHAERSDRARAGIPGAPSPSAGAKANAGAILPSAGFEGTKSVQRQFEISEQGKPRASNWGDHCEAATGVGSICGGSSCAGGDEWRRCGMPAEASERLDDRVRELAASVVDVSAGAGRRSCCELNRGLSGCTCIAHRSI